jgi:hypothetical protein
MPNATKIGGKFGAGNKVLWRCGARCNSAATHHFEWRIESEASINPRDAYECLNEDDDGGRDAQFCWCPLAVSALMATVCAKTNETMTTCCVTIAAVC